MLVSCPVVSEFWKIFLEWYETLTAVKLELSTAKILYGIIDNDRLCKLTNHLLLIAKYYIYCSPVPELSFLPSPYRGWTRADERRVQDNLHAHAQNIAIFPPKSGKNHIWKYFPDLALWRNFLNDNIQATISAFRMNKNMPINPKSVEFHQCHAKQHSICFFFYYNIKDNERNLCQDLLTVENTDSDLNWSARAALCKWATCTRQTFLSKTFAKSLNIQKQYEMFGKRVMTRTHCRQEYRTG